MSVEYDADVDIGEESRMAPEGVITEDNIDQLRADAIGAVEEPPKNKMEAPLQDKVNRKKQRSKKQMETFEKARAKRLENIKRKKAERKAMEEQLESGEQPPPDKTPEAPPPSEIPSVEEQVKELEEIQKEVLEYDPPPRRERKKKKEKKVVYEDDYGEQAEFRPSRRRSYKPVNFSDVFKYA